MKHLIPCLAVVILSGVGLLSCGGSPTAPATPPAVSPTATVMTVSGSPPAVHATSQLAATVVDSKGTAVDVTASATWRSSNPGVATVSATGVATGVGEGRSTISATYQGITGSQDVLIGGNSAIIETGIVSITISGHAPAVGSTSQYSATAKLTDNSTANATTLVDWRSSDASVITVSDTGLVRAVGKGGADLTASYRNVTGTLHVAITTAGIVSITISGKAPAVGATSQYAATATLPDNSTADVTTQATWRSSDASVVTVSDSGLVRGVKAGEADLTATSEAVTGTLHVAIVAGGCAFDVSPSTLVVPPTGGTASVTVTSTRGSGCTWTASSDSAFATITGGANGTDDGTVALTVSANNSRLRIATLTVAGHTVTVTQESYNCVSALAPQWTTVPAAGGTGTVGVTANPTCAWHVMNDYPFITITGGSGLGKGQFSYSLAANPDAQRLATINVGAPADRTPFFLTQEGACGYVVSPTSIVVPPAGGSATVTVTARQSTPCPWTAISQNVNVSIVGAASGTGSGSVSFTMTPNAGDPMTATLVIAGQVVTVTQDAPTCMKSLSPQLVTLSADGGTGTVAVTTKGPCTWRVVNNSPFITITSGSPGNGDGQFTYAVAANPGAEREATLRVGPPGFEIGLLVWQQAATCTFAVSPTTIAMAGQGGQATVAITTTRGTNCGWRAWTDSSLINWTSPIMGSGNGQVTFSMSNNPLAAVRSATLTIASQVVTVTQDIGFCVTAVSPQWLTIPSTGGTGTIAITAGTATCGWRAVNNSAFVTVTAGASGNGSGTLTYSVAPNPGARRQATLFVGAPGTEIAIFFTQDASPTIR